MPGEPDARPVVHADGDTPAYTLDGTTLREVFDDPAAARAWCSTHPDHPLVVAVLRATGDLDGALRTGRRLLAGREPGSARWAAAAIRLAHVHHWREEWDDAHELLDRAGALAGQLGDESLTGFVHQHRAKVYFDAGDLDSAEAEAQSALAIRRRRDEPALVHAAQQTQAAIERRRARA